MLPTIEIGPLVIPTAGLLYILGAWLVLSVVERTAGRLRLDVPAVYAVAVAALAGGFIGARLTFVALHWSAYANNPLGVIWPLTSGYTAWGGLLIGGAAAVYTTRWKRLAPAGTLDALAPGLLLGLIIVSLADFLAGPGYGKETLLPWGIELFGIRRHPVQLYELAAGLAALGGWWFAVRRWSVPGRPFLLAIAIYSAGRLLTDTFRANSPLTAGGYHVIQIVALVVLLLSLYFLIREKEPNYQVTGT